MPTTIENKFEIKIEFQPRTEDPSRIFRAMASLIDSVTKLDFLFIKSVNSSFQSKLVLEEVEKGSMVTKLIETITIDEQNVLGAQSQVAENVSAYIVESRQASIEVLQDPSETNSAAKVQRIIEKINEVADRQNVRTLGYVSPAPIELGKSLKQVSDSLTELKEAEAVTYTPQNESTRPPIQIKPDVNFTIEQIEESETQEVLTNTSTVYLKIKRPDFLGDSQWEFKRGEDKIVAKIRDEAWLTKFKTGEIVTIPGDSLKAELTETASYDRLGQLISIQREINIVHDVIRSQSSRNERLL